MIKVKKKKCKSCGQVTYLWSNGECKNCCQKNYIPMKATKKNKPNHVLKMYSSMSGKPGVSLESGTRIPEITPVNLAHIFPKEIYKSVASNKDNIIVLTWEEHTRFDELLSTFKFSTLEKDFKNSWPKVCQRVKEILPLVTESGFLKFEFENYFINQN